MTADADKAHTPSRRSPALTAYYFVPAGAWLLVIFLASTNAGAEQSTLRGIINIFKLLLPEQTAGLPIETLSKINFVVRKCAHLSEYAVLFLLIVRAIQFGAFRLKWQAATGAVALCAFYAASDEFHQSFVPGRTSAVRDIVIDCMGALFALICTILWFSLKAVERNLWHSQAASPHDAT